MNKRTFEVTLFFPETEFRNRYMIDRMDFEDAHKWAQEELEILYEQDMVARIESINDVTGRPPL